MLRTVLRTVDAISEVTGKVPGMILCPALVLVVSYEVIARYVFNAPTLWSYDTTWMLGAAIIAMGWAYTHKHHGHVRVDILYTHCSPRGKVVIDLVCTLFLFFPLIGVLTYRAFDWMWYAWSTGEIMLFTILYPPSGPIRTVVFIGFSLFALQGIAKFIRDLHLLIRGAHD